MYASRISRLTTSATRDIVSISQRKNLVSFAVGMPNQETFPCIDTSSAPIDLYQYGTSEGEPQLRSAIRESLREKGIHCDKDQVIITSGSQQGIDLASKLFVEEETPVCTEEVTYQAALQCFKLYGAKIHGVTMNGAGMIPEHLERLLKSGVRPALVYLVPTFHNPTGVCYSKRVREEIAYLLKKYKVPLVEDDPYRELSFVDQVPTPITSMLQDSHWIYLGSYSKVSVPSIRVGYMACSRELVPHLVALKQATDLHTNRISQWWLANFIQSSGYREHLARLRTLYAGKRDVMRQGLEKHFSDIATWETPEGGFFFWLKMGKKCDTRRMLEYAIDSNIAFMPGEVFYANNIQEFSSIRLSFSCLENDVIETGLESLSGIIRNFPER